MATGTIKSIKNIELVTENYLVADNFNLSSGTVATKSLAIEKEGYTPIGLVGYKVTNGTSGSGSGMSYIHFYQCALTDIQEGSATITMMIRNSTSSNVSNAAIYADVLWEKG